MQTAPVLNQDCLRVYWHSAAITIFCYIWNKTAISVLGPERKEYCKMSRRHFSSWGSYQRIYITIRWFNVSVQSWHVFSRVWELNKNKWRCIEQRTCYYSISSDATFWFSTYFICKIYPWVGRMPGGHDARGLHYMQFKLSCDYWDLWHIIGSSTVLLRLGSLNDEASVATIIHRIFETNPSFHVK